MPLPSNGTLSLQGYSRPGDAVQTKPKRAMLVRMSAEVLDALSEFPTQPQMDFEFGNNSGIHIGDKFFPMRSLKEDAAHDIYLRASSAAKPNAPLKLHAGVVGKFTVERQMGESIGNEIRDQSIAAEKKRKERKTILLDAPPPDVSTGTGKSAKRKAPAGSASLLKQATKAEHLRASPASSPLPNRGPSPRAVSPAPSAAHDELSVQNRLIRLLASRPSNTADVLRMLAPNYGNTQRDEIMDLLGQFADNSQRVWRLKSHGWIEARPWQWPNVSTAQRHEFASAMRKALIELKIPRSDPRWKHSQEPPSNGSPASLDVAGSSARHASSSPKPRADAKKPQEVKERAKATAKAQAPKAHSEIRIKDESVKPSRSATPTRGTAGTGEGSDRKPKPVPARPSGGAEQPRRTGPVDARADRKPRPAPSLPAKPVASVPPPAVDERRSTSGTPMRRIKDEMSSTKSANSHRILSDASTTKRRKDPYEDDEHERPASERGEKRRKAEDGGRVMLSTQTHKPDTSLPPKPVTRRESSPLARTTIKDGRSFMTGSVNHTRPSLPASSSRNAHARDAPERPRANANGASSKSRRERNLHVYTSSEDEGPEAGEVEEPEPEPEPAPARASAATSRRITRAEGRANLHALYNETFLEYMVTVNELKRQHKAIIRSVKHVSAEGDAELDRALVERPEFDALLERRVGLLAKLDELKEMNFLSFSGSSSGSPSS